MYYKVSMGVDKSIAKVSRLGFVTRYIYVVGRNQCFSLKRLLTLLTLIVVLEIGDTHEIPQCSKTWDVCLFASFHNFRVPDIV